MIHNSSHDPVLIKKISLKVWSLRDEIECRIQEKMDKGEIVPENLEASLLALKGEYTKKKKIENNVLALKSPEDLGGADGEDEMAKAMAEAMNSEEPESEAPNENVETNSSDNVVQLTTINDNNVEISIAPPPLSEDKMSKGKTVLSEISMEKMFFFSNKAYTEGQSVVIQFCIPKTFILNADVYYCRPFNIKSRVISKNNYSFRMLVKFNFLKEGERALLRQFIESIEPEVTKQAPKAASSNETSDEGDFNELDDLGL